MARVILGNAFSVTMIPVEAHVYVKRLTLEEFKAEAQRATECVIGHESTRALAEIILGRTLSCERRMVTLSPGDKLVVLLPKFRIEEGKVYSLDELLTLYGEGKIAFYSVTVFEPGHRQSVGDGGDHGERVARRRGRISILRR